MRHDIQPNERSFSTKEVAEEAGIATPTVRKYGQILERNGYEFLKDGDRRIFVQSDIESLIALRDTDKSLDDTAKDLVNQQKDRLEGFNETEIAIPDTYDNLPRDPNQLKEILMFLSNELAATREMNVQLTNSMSQLKTTVSRLQQDHHVISSAIGNSAQKTHAKIEKLTEQQKIHYETLTEQQKTHYETLLQQEKQKSEFLQKELQHIRDEQKKVWRSQNDFNKRLEEVIQKPKEKWGRLFSIFRK
jgi:chromosome segregation ATPase